MLTASPSLFRYRQGGCGIICLVTGNQWKQNSYLVIHEASGRTAIIDPGDGAETIIGEVAWAGGKVTRILLTHPHHDHVGAAQKLAEHYRVPCELHQDDARLLMHAPMYALSFAKKKIDAVSSFRKFEELPAAAEEPRLRALHTPGHTKGSVCYLFDGFAFTGDTLLYRHVGRTDLPGASAQELERSIEKLLCEADPETVLFPGHGRPWSVAQAREWWRESVSSPPKYDSFSKL